MIYFQKRSLVWKLTSLDPKFSGLTFLVEGFEEDEIQQISAQIHGLGGKRVSSKYLGIADYGIVPLKGAQLKNTVTEVVTNLFIVSFEFSLFPDGTNNKFFFLSFIGRLHR